MKVLLALAVLFAPAAARADQCQLLDAATAAKVRAIVEQPHRYAELCEPCGEHVPALPFTPRTVEVTDELVLDGMPRDLAYTYVKTHADRFENLAMLVGCPVHGVSPSLSVEAETEHGEMITANSAPVIVARVEPPPPPTPPVAASAAPAYYSTTITYAVPWIAIAAFAGSAGFMLGVAATLLVLALRRRRAMQPRATCLG